MSIDADVLPVAVVGNDDDAGPGDRTQPRSSIRAPVPSLKRFPLAIEALREAGHGQLLSELGQALLSESVARAADRVPTDADPRSGWHTTQRRRRV